MVEKLKYKINKGTDVILMMPNNDKHTIALRNDTFFFENQLVVSSKTHNSNFSKDKPVSIFDEYVMAGFVGFVDNPVHPSHIVLIPNQKVNEV